MNARSRLPRRTAMQAAIYALALAACRPLRDQSGLLAATPEPTRTATNLPLPTVIARPSHTPLPTRAPAPEFRLPEGDQPGRLPIFAPAGIDTVRLTFVPNTRTIAISNQDARIYFYDLTSGERVNILEYEPPDEYGNFITDMAFLPDGARLVVATRGRIDLWDVAARTFQALTEDHVGFQWIGLSPNGTLLAAGPTNEQQIELRSDGLPSTNAVIMDTKTWTKQRVLVDANPPYEFGPDNKTLATLSGINFTYSSCCPGPIVLWDVTTGARREFSVEGFPVAMTYSPDGNSIAVYTLGMTSETGEVIGVRGTLLLDASNGKVRHILDTGIAESATVFSPDGSILASLNGPQIILWDVVTGTQLAVLDGADRVLHYPWFSADGGLIGAVSSGSGLFFWNVPR